MDILASRMQRLKFYWRHSLLGQRWIMILIAACALLTALLIHACWQQQQLQQALQQLPTRPAPTVNAVQSTQTATATLLQQWPAEDEADRISAEILAQADALGMLFDRAEFQTVSAGQALLQIQRIKLPLKGDYLQVRQFIQRVLQAYPSLALSQFKLQRTDVMQPGIEAYIEFSLYTRKRAQS
jgi:Tfp pilus assembly protein PilO